MDYDTKASICRVLWFTSATVMITCGVYGVISKIPWVPLLLMAGIVLLSVFFVFSDSLDNYFYDRYERKKLHELYESFQTEATQIGLFIEGYNESKASSPYLASTREDSMERKSP